MRCRLTVSTDDASAVQLILTIRSISFSLGEILVRIQTRGRVVHVLRRGVFSMQCHGIRSFNLRRRPLSVGKAIGASVFLFLDLS
jgi:hypothetical protein